MHFRAIGGSASEPATPEDISSSQTAGTSIEKQPAQATVAVCVFSLLKNQIDTNGSRNEQGKPKSAIENGVGTVINTSAQAARFVPCSRVRSLSPKTKTATQ